MCVCHRWCISLLCSRMWFFWLCWSITFSYQEPLMAYASSSFQNGTNSWMWRSIQYSDYTKIQYFGFKMCDVRFLTVYFRSGLMPQLRSLTPSALALVLWWRWPVTTPTTTTFWSTHSHTICPDNSNNQIKLWTKQQETFTMCFWPCTSLTFVKEEPFQLLNWKKANSSIPRSHILLLTVIAGTLWLLPSRILWQVSSPDLSFFQHLATCHIFRMCRSVKLQWMVSFNLLWVFFSTTSTSMNL